MDSNEVYGDIDRHVTGLQLWVMPNVRRRTYALCMQCVPLQKRLQRKRNIGGFLTTGLYRELLVESYYDMIRNEYKERYGMSPILALLIGNLIWYAIKAVIDWYFDDRPTDELIASCANA